MTTVVTRPAEHPLVAAAREMVPHVRELAPVIERERKLPAELVKEFLRAGFFHTNVRHSIGGLQTDPWPAAEVVEEISRGDGSAGWCIMIAAQNATFGGFMGDAEARQIWGESDIACGTARPTGRAVIADGGYRVSGRWPFASGSSHATWFMGESTVYEGDQPKLDAEGNAMTRMTFLPRESVVIHDTWETTGLRGTASNDFSCEDVYVPAGRAFQIFVEMPHHDWALYRAFPLAMINHGTQSLGVARAALEAATDAARSKTGWGGVRIADVPRVQQMIAEATVSVESARTYLCTVTEELWQAALAGGGGTALQRARVRLAASHAAAASVRAVDLVHSALATTAIFTKSPLERHFRDIHTASAHVMVSNLTYEAAGRVELGMDPAFPFF